MKLIRTRNDISPLAALLGTAILPKRKPNIASAPPRYWLNAERIAIYSKAFLFSQVAVALCFLLAEVFFPPQPDQYFIANDFRVFWAASHLGLQGHGSDAYNIDRLFPAQQLATPLLVYPKAWQHWFYPPTYLLAVLPLALLPYLVSYILFTVASIALYLYVLRRIAPSIHTIVLGLAFPAVLFAAVNGQNSFITASIGCLALLWLDRHPMRAGFAIGLLTIKPQLALLLFVVTFCSKRWKAFTVAVITSVTFLFFSITIFGIDSIPSFFKSIQIAKAFSEYGLLPLHKMPTIFVSARLMGVDILYANTAHLIIATAATLTVIYLWRIRASSIIRNSSLIIGTLLISPHLFDYDLVWLAWPIAWMAINGMQNGWYKGEKQILLAAWISPLSGGISLFLKIQIVPVILIAMLLYLLIRARSTTKESDAHNKITFGSDSFPSKLGV
jgi:hypothetical protein